MTFKSFARRLVRCPMLVRVLSLLPVAVLLSFAVARGADVDEVKEKIFQAKKEYDGEVQKFRRAVEELLDRREEAARRVGNKKMVDQVKADRERFNTAGEPPAGLTTGHLRQVASARAALDRAYQSAVRDCVRLKADDAADAIEKQRQQFLLASAFVAGKRTRLSSLKPSDVRVWNNWFEKDTAKYKMGGVAIPHSVFMHPNFKGDASASYALPPRVIAFRASVGVPKHADRQGDPASPLTFEVLGDGRSLWKSEPITKLDAFQTCEVRVEKVKTLTLRVHCPQEHGGAHCVWFGPVLVE